jgi:hypothetical protein
MITCHRHSGWLCALVVGFLLQPAQEASAQESRQETQRDPWAVQFRVTENFTLGSFEGSVLALKRHLTPHHSIRASLGLSLRGQTSEATRDTLLSSRENDAHAVNINMEYLWYARPQSTISLFLGGGPLFQYARSSSSTAFPSPSPSITRTDKAFGIRAVVGVEWFVTRQIGLHSEYGVETVRNTQEQTNRSPFSPPYTTKVTSWSVEGRSAYLGASVYF